MTPGDGVHPLNKLDTQGVAQVRKHRPVMRDVADRAGVALSTVSRVLSGHPDVGPDMRVRVMSAAVELGYEPDILAQSLRTGETMTVGFVVGDISNPLISQIARGAEASLRQSGRAMLLMNSFNDPILDRQHIGLLNQRRVDGLILSISDDIDPETAKVIAELPIPCVLVDRQLAGADSAAVLSDHSKGIKQAFDYLVGGGHRRIGLVNGYLNVRPARERSQTLLDLAEIHQEVSVDIRNSSFTAEHGFDSTIDMLSSDYPPTAIIAGGNQILVGILRALKKLSLRVGVDVALVTSDDIPLLEFLDPPMPTISRNPEEMGRQAAGLLLEMLAGGPRRTLELPTHLRFAGSEDSRDYGWIE